MRTEGSGLARDWREGRRFRALELHESGWIGERIAEALGVTAGAVSQSLTRARVGGREALRTHPPPGPVAKLSAEQRAARPEVLANGAEAYDFVGDLWNAKRGAVVIPRVFGVSYHPAAFRGPAIVGFLRQLLRQVRGTRLVIWDGAPIHHCHPVKDFLAAGAAKRRRLERLPADAPDLNPDEGVWNHLTRGELNNRCGHDLDELRGELGLAIRRLRRTPSRLVGCFQQCGYL